MAMGDCRMWREPMADLLVFLDHLRRGVFFSLVRHVYRMQVGLQVLIALSTLPGTSLTRKDMYHHLQNA